MTKQKHQGKLKAAVILQQLGGNRFIAMTGAQGLTCGGQDDRATLMCKIMRNQSGANYLKIEENGLDLYDMTLISVRGANMKIKEKATNLYADMLKSTFTNLTGLATHL